MAVLQKVVRSKSIKGKSFGMTLARAHSYNVATPVPHPLSPQSARGDSSGSPERPKRGLSGTYRPLLGRSSEPNARVEGFWQLSIWSGPRISGVPGVR